MTKSELIQALKNRLPDLQERDVALAVNVILTQMTEALAQGERIEIRGFGCFDCQLRDSRLTRNPKTGEAVHSSATVRVHFKPGKNTRDRVNAARDKCRITE